MHDYEKSSTDAALAKERMDFGLSDTRIANSNYVRGISPFVKLLTRNLPRHICSQTIIRVTEIATI
jgi:hypothetical protein